MNQINQYFSPDGLIIFCKANEYNKIKPLKFEEIMCIMNTLESNPKFNNLENKICYISCCLYLLSKYNDKYIPTFSKKILSQLSLKQNPINDSYLFTIYNCIDYDENFLHSDKKRLDFLLKYLERFSSLNKTKENYLLFKYYTAILKFRLGRLEEASKESIGIVLSIEEDKDNISNFIKFIQLKNELFQIKLNEACNDKNALKENYSLLLSVFDKVKNENPFLCLKIGLSIYHNLYSQSLYKDCIPILQQLYQILKNYEKQGINPKKMLRFSLSVYCRFGLIGILLSNRQLVELAIDEMNNGLLLIKDDRNHKKSMAIFKAYTFALTLIKLNSNILVETLIGISNIFMKEFISDKFNNEGKYLGDSYCVNNQNINQCLINLNTINNSVDLSINDKTQKILDFYIDSLSNPEKKLIVNDAIFTFIIGIHDKIRYISEKYLIDRNKYNQEKYKAQILLNANYFWKYINENAESEPLLKTEFFKSIIIKIFSCCVHVYYYNNDFNTLSKSINHFDNLSKKLNINENTPSYELVFKVKGDYYFKKNDYNTSITCYNNSILKMNDKNPKKPVLLFNLGVLYYYLGDKNSSIKYFQKSAQYFKKVNEEKSTFEFHKRNNILTKKFNLVQYLIKEIQNN